MSPTELRHGKPEAYCMEPKRIRRRRSVIGATLASSTMVVQTAVNRSVVGSSPT